MRLTPSTRGPVQSLVRVAFAALSVAAPASLHAQTPTEALTASAARVADCQGPGPHITVAVEGLRSTKGDLVVEIYPDDAKRFLAHKAQVASVHQKITNLNPSVCLTPPAPGYYAIAVFHDENSDYKLNQNALGIPTEGFGLSNNPGLRFGKPSFSQVRLRLDDDMTVRIRMRYVLGGGSAK